MSLLKIVYFLSFSASQFSFKALSVVCLLVCSLCWSLCLSDGGPWSRGPVSGWLALLHQRRALGRVVKCQWLPAGLEPGQPSASVGSCLSGVLVTCSSLSLVLRAARLARDLPRLPRVRLSVSLCEDVVGRRFAGRLGASQAAPVQQERWRLAVRVPGPGSHLDLLSPLSCSTWTSPLAESPRQSLCWGLAGGRRVPPPGCCSGGGGALWGPRGRPRCAGAGAAWARGCWRLSLPALVLHAGCGRLRPSGRVGEPDARAASPQNLPVDVFSVFLLVSSFRPVGRLRWRGGGDSFSSAGRCPGLAGSPCLSVPVGGGGAFVRKTV